ncbi:MAG: hypothetical protein M1822_008141 [Bathelium mastoideum]|nr:MAG: hypothetical protein M1822_008141 [Bathelium mastoideum]
MGGDTEVPGPGGEAHRRLAVSFGLGLTADKPLKQGETTVVIPASLLLTIDSPHLRRLRLPPRWSTHGKLATALVLWHGDATAPLQEWRAILPTAAEMTDVMPLTWSRGQEFLPPRAASHLEEQRVRLERDWVAATSDSILADTLSLRETFTYCWLLVNTRCFYWDYPFLPKHSQKRRKLSQEPQECMAMCPFIDCFNHGSRGCEVNFTQKGYTVTCDRDYAVGEQLFISYGSFDNDFLLIDYGFLLPHPINSSDSISLDHHILARLSPSQIDHLKGAGYESNYVLHGTSDSLAWVPCHRTQVALLLLNANESDWRSFVHGRELREEEAKKMNRVLIDICKSLRDEAQNKLRSIDELESGGDGEDDVVVHKTLDGEDDTVVHKTPDGGLKGVMADTAKSALRTRWSQIHLVASQVIEDLDQRSKLPVI